MSGKQYDLVNTKESIFPICDKPYHTNKRILQKGEEFKSLRNYALSRALFVGGGGTKIRFWSGRCCPTFQLYHSEIFLSPPLSVAFCCVYI